MLELSLFEGGKGFGWLLYAIYVFPPTFGIILTILGVWLKVAKRDTIKGYGTVMGMGIAMLLGYAAAIVKVIVF